MALNFLNNGYFGGKLGIGIESPTTSLHVDSVSAFPTLTLARSTTHSGISFTAGISNYTGAGADLLFDGVGSNTGFGFRTRNSSNTQVNALVIAPSGNVGIGTATPQQKLDVVGRVRASYDTSNYYEIGASSAGGFVVGKSGGVETVNIRTYGDSHFNGGNFGIGTSSPTAKLHVAGTGLFTGLVSGITPVNAANDWCCWSCVS